VTTTFTGCIATGQLRTPAFLSVDASSGSSSPQATDPTQRNPYGCQNSVLMSLGRCTACDVWLMPLFVQATATSGGLHLLKYIVAPSGRFDQSPSDYLKHTKRRPGKGCRTRQPRQSGPCPPCRECRRLGRMTTVSTKARSLTSRHFATVRLVSWHDSVQPHQSSTASESPVLVAPRMPDRLSAPA
jgi:hypothetical protein